MSNIRFSRRGFFKTAAAASTGLSESSLLGLPTDATPSGTDPKTPAAPGSLDFTRQSPALEADQVIDSACQFCNSLCRLKVHLKNGRIIAGKRAYNAVVEDPANVAFEFKRLMGDRQKFVFPASS